jgi:DNA-binding HxlR family transcriptional regulator
MEGKYMRLSKQKFSSNVVEKCLKQSSTHWRTIIIRELTAQPSVSELLRDRYGNYVLQTALSVATPQQVSFYITLHI